MKMTSLKETKLGPLPEDWEVVRLGDIIPLKELKKGDIKANEKVRKILKGLGVST